MPSASSSSPEAAHRLPRTALPRRYEVRLTPDFMAARFSGTVRVTLDVLEPVAEIVCNAADLTITDARLVGPSGSVGLTVRLEPEREQARFCMPAPAAPARYTLEADFAGRFDGNLRGFFLSGWIDAAGAPHAVASTQFQSTDARRAFPCWDEPDLKAVFAVTLDVPPGCTGVSNGPEVAATPLPDGWRRVRFGDTPPMSTYLVAFVVGPLEATAPVDVDGVPLRVVHVPGKAHLAPFALEVGAHALRFFAAWTGVPYPAAKLDLIAIPERGGAMENLGAAIFVESALLIDAAAAAPAEVERVAEVVSHEIAHMWFGDLVTMRWWNGLWLNEAFATFITVHCLEHFRPRWRSWLAFSVQRERAMFVDALPSARPVEFPVGRPDEAEAMYDLLTYQKGAALLRMLEEYLGAEAFREGVRRFLRAHAYDNADGGDLWAALAEAAGGEPVGEIMATWIFQGGYPLIEVEGSRLRQRPFALLPGSEAQGAAWLVPCPLDDGRMLLRPDAEATAAGRRIRPGYYRVRRHGGWADLDPAGRFSAAADTWACVLAGIAPLEEFLALCEPLVETADPILFTVLEDAIVTLDHAGGGLRLQAWTRALLGPVLARVGWEPAAGEQPDRPQLRAALIALLGNVGEDPAVIGRARVAPGASGAVLAVAAAHGGADDLTALLAGYRHPANPQEEQRHLEALAACHDPGFAQELLAMCLTGMKRQHAGVLLSRMMANRHVGRQAWRFVRERWDDLAPRFFGKGFWRMLAGAGWLTEDADDVRAFLAVQELGGMRRLADQVVEALEVRRAFARREGPRLDALLAP